MTAKATETKNDDGSITQSYKLSEMSVEQLAMVNQAIGRQIDKLREDRLKINELIKARIAKDRRDVAMAEIARLQAQVDGEAPGAVIEATVAKE